MRNLFLLLFFFIFCRNTFAISNDEIIPPVIVSAKKAASTHTLTHSTKTTITQDEISNIGAASLTQALQELGGVQLQDTSGTSSQVLVSMRGFGANASSNTLLLINGIPITNPDLAPPDLNAIPIQEVELIEVIAGSESVLYGDQAVGGIVNIITRKHTKEKINASCAVGSYNTRNCYTSLNGKFKKLNYGLNISNNFTNNYRYRNNYSQNHLSGALDLPYNTGNFAFNYQISNERMQYPGALTALQVEQNRRQAANETDFFRDWNGFYDLVNQQQLGSNWQLETSLVRREMHGDGVLTTPFFQSRIIHFIKEQIKGAMGKVIITSGIDFEQDKYHLRSLFGTTDDNENKYGIFGVVNYPATQRLSLSLGARGAQQSNSLESFQSSDTLNRAFASTLGATFSVNDKTKIYLRRAENFRFPKADENASTPIGVNGLKTQRGVSYETGLELEHNKSTTKFGLYLLNLRDEITFDPTQTPQQPFGANRNLAPTTRPGLSLSENYYFNDKLTLGGQYNYVHARFQSGPNAGNHIPLVSDSILHAGADYKINQYWNFYTEAIYTGNQYPANDDANIAGKIGGYTVYNFNLRYHFQQISAAFRVNNIFNKYYYYYTVFQPGMPESFYPASGRNFLITVKCVFA